MSKNFDQNFSLKDWVTKRAANTPEQAEEEILLQAVGETGGGRIEKRSIEATFIVPEQTEENSAADTDAMEKPQQKMTARITNTDTPLSASLTPAMAASPTQQIQIVRLLRDLGDRLRQSEKEREILWKELDSCRKILTDIEDKTNNTEKAFLSIEHKISSRPEINIEEANEFKKEIEGKISALETTTGSAILRLEDAISENTKLARRLEEVSQDKIQLQHKIEALEGIITQTQEMLKAKALVLLTDHALANKTGLPQTSAWSGNDTLRTKETSVEDSAVFGANSPWWKTPSRTGTHKGALASLIILGLAGGWAVSKVDFPSLRSKIFETIPSVSALQTPFEKTAVKEVPADTQPAATQIQTTQAPPVPAKDQTQLMNDVAKLANQIEPGTEKTAEAQNIPNTSNAPTSVPAAPVKSADIKEDENPVDTAQDQAKNAEQKALNDFNVNKPVGILSQRIKPDASLSAAVKAIEAKAFSGNAEAQHDLAAIYTAGHAGVKTNYPKAAAWFTEAAHNGIANAQYNLAVLYHQGLGVKQDTAKAIDLYRIAASNNHPEAEYNLGIAHIEGLGADYNPQIAAYYFQKAAMGGVVEAAYNLGLIQENGLLGEAQPEEALFWYKLASLRNDAQATQALAQLSKQLNMTPEQVDQTYKRISEQKADIVKGFQAALVKPAATPQSPSQPQKAATSAPVKIEPVKSANVSSYDPVIVAQIQEQLIRLGLFSGSADGTADLPTQNAVKSYQSMNKLKVDGKPTEDVLVHMLASEMQAPSTQAN